MFEGLRFQHWRTRLDSARILTLTLDRAEASANSLSGDVLEELGRILERIGIEPPKGVIIVSGKPSSFIVGADIKEFEQYAKQNRTADAITRGHRVFDRLAALRCPTVAAIHGACMGGGTELALACRYRVASTDPKTRIGLPEVNLGIHPGWGGLARMPRLIGPPAAFDLMLTGRSVAAPAAKAMGIVDRVAEPGDPLLEAAKVLLAKGATRPLARRLASWALHTWPARQVLASMMAKQVARKANPKHYPSPSAMIECWRRFGGNLPGMLRAEARSVTKLATTPTAHNLVRLFFLQEQLKGLGGKSDPGIRNVHVVGAGVMGGDIAAWCALQGMNVTLQDREMKYIQPALDRSATLFEKKLKTPEKIAEASKRLVADVDGKGVAGADLVIEAIFENAEAKQELYARLEPQLKPGAILVSNTSSIPLATLTEKLADKSRFAGLHYFNPVAQMMLVEIVRHDAAVPDTLRRLQGFTRAIDKLPVPVAASPGFLVNRILMPYMLESITAWSEGVPGPALDKAAKSFGMPMGPIELADTVGLDVAASVGKILGPFLGLELPKGVDDRLAAGQRGKKDGRGLYEWVDGKPVKPEVPADYVPPADLADRLILPMVNEAVACLAEGVVESEELLDAGIVFGTGFAPFRGGPCRYVRETGAAVLQERLRALAAKYGKRFEPKAGWDRFA